MLTWEDLWRLPVFLSLCQAQSWSTIYIYTSILAGDETSLACIYTLHWQMCGGPDCLQELVFTLLRVLCPSHKSPITASEDAADTFLETWQPALTVVTKLQLSHH